MAGEHLVIHLIWNKGRIKPDYFMYPVVSAQCGHKRKKKRREEGGSHILQSLVGKLLNVMDSWGRRRYIAFGGAWEE